MLLEVIQTKDYAKATALTVSGEKLPANMQDYQRSSLYDTMVREKAYETILAMADKRLIETDIYEYEKFGNTIVESITRWLDESPEAQAFLAAFVGKLDNRNDEVQGSSVLSYALEQEAAPGVIATLIANGCNAHVLNRAEENLLHQVVRKYTTKFDRGLAYLEMLVNAGLETDKPNIVKQTPLHLAVSFHRLPYIKFMLEHGADPNAPDAEGKTPFYMAVAETFDWDKYKLMREFATPDFSLATRDGETTLYKYIGGMGESGEHLDFLKMMLEDGADIYQTSVHYGRNETSLDAVAKNASAILEVVLASGQLDVNRPDDQGNTMLHKVCAYDSNHSETVAKETYRKVKILLEAGADPNLLNDKEQSPLMLASTDNLKTKTVELLLKHK